MEKENKEINSNEEIFDEDVAKQEEVIVEEGSEEVPDSSESEDEEKISITGEQFAKLEEELAKEKEEKEKYIDRLQNLQAEFSNYRKRVIKEKSTLAEQTTRDFVLELLPIIDNFERALAAVEGNDQIADVLQGIKMIYRQLVNTIEKTGVNKIKTVGEEFDPNLHEAVMKEVSDEYDSGVIIEELQTGYKFNDFVIRPAMVKVAE